MKISKKETDFRIYVEDEEQNYLYSYSILASEKDLHKTISNKIFINPELKGIGSKSTQFDLSLTRREYKIFSKLLNEFIKHLEEDEM